MNIVFGSGMCVSSHWRYIEKYFHPNYLISNSKRKWGNFKLGNLVCTSPEEVLSNCSAFEETKVLIAVGDPDSIKTIKCQLDPYGVDVQTIYEFVEENGKYEPIPRKFAPLEKEHGRHFLLFNVAEHDNIGDHLITLAEREFLERRFPEYPCIDISDIEYMWFHHWLKGHVSSEDIVFLTGGGFLGSLYLYGGEFNFRKIISDYQDNFIITFPQTIFFENSPRGKEVSQTSKTIYNSHDNLVLNLRERNSYNVAKDLLDKGTIELVPDIVLSLDYSKGSEKKGGKGINVCLRSDKESLFPTQENEKLCTDLGRSGYHVFYSSMHSGIAINETSRREICKKKQEEILKSDLVITDTLHCMILCAITGTPCIAIDTISHKIKYVYEWLRGLKYIKLAATSREILSLASEMFTLGKSPFPINDIRPFFVPLENRIREAAQICPKN